MNDPVSQPVLSTPSNAGVAPPPSQPFSATRLMAGGLSLLLVLAIALAAGVPAGQLLATVGGHGPAQGELERAVAPRVVERQARRLAQERPVPAGVHSLTTCGGSEGSVSDGVRGVCVVRPVQLVREALLALPPPALRA